jgi:hypothetical protein
MSNPAIELDRRFRSIDRTRGLTIAAWICAITAGLFLAYSGIRNANETQKELRLIPGLKYDDRVDFAYFYAAAILVWHGDGADLYPHRHEYIYYPGDPAFDLSNDDYLSARLITRGNYYNPPLLAILLSPLSTMSFRDAFWIYSLLSAAAFAGFLVLFWKTGRRLPELPLLLLGLAAFRPVHEALIMGHQSLFFVFALGAGFLALRARQPLLAGLLLSVLALKPQWAVLPALYLVVRGEWRALAAMTAGSLAIALLPFLATGKQSFVNYIDFLRDQSNVDIGNAPHMFSWNGFLSKLRPNDPVAFPTGDVNLPLLYTLEGITVAAVLLVWAGRDFYLGVAATIIGMLLLSTHSVWYDWAFVAVAAAFLALRPAPVTVRAQVWVLLLALFVSAAQSTDVVFAPDGRHGLIHWSEAGFFSVTLVAAATLLWIAGRVVIEGQLRLPARFAPSRTAA